MAKMIKEAHGDRYVHQSQALIPLATPIDASSESNEDEQLDKLIQAAKEILSEDYSYIHQFVLTEQLGDCRNDLMEFGVEFDTWFSEQSLFDNGLITKAITTLEKNHMTYQQDGALWFRSTRFGDEKDRVIQRENGQYTYFASDIAYAGIIPRPQKTGNCISAIRRTLSRRQKSFHVNPLRRICHPKGIA
jgi:arginyl-tRNA synthetase